MISLLLLAQMQPSPEPAGDVVQWGLSLIKWIAEQFASKNYAAAVAGIVMAIVFVLKLVLKDKLSSGSLPLVSAIVGTVVSGAGALLGATQGMGATAILSILVTGLTTGATASGLWSLVGKRVVDFVKSKFSKDAVAPTAPATEVKEEGK